MPKIPGQPLWEPPTSHALQAVEDLVRRYQRDESFYRLVDRLTDLLAHGTAREDLRQATMLALALWTPPPDEEQTP